MTKFTLPLDCLAGGTHGHQHCRDVLAGLLRDFTETLAECMAPIGSGSPNTLHNQCRLARAERSTSRSENGRRSRHL